jgi:hypothetical protein
MRIQGVAMSENLSFDSFVSKIHQVFEKLPDYRSSSPNLKYQIKDAALGAFSMFFSQALKSLLGLFKK